jgi:very-short-patch-repair endonuclease
MDQEPSDNRTRPDDAIAPHAPPTRAERLAALSVVASGQAGIVTRTQAYDAGITRGEVRAQIRAQRWRRLGTHCLALFTGDLLHEAQCWVAVLEAGPRAFIDGEAALLLAGLEHYTAERIRVSVPRGARIRHRGSHIDIRQTRRWNASDLADGPGARRSRAPVAAVRAALWARSDRQAALLLTMTVQQGLASIEELSVEILRVRRDRRRALLASMLLDLSGGVRSLNELDVLRGCRDRGLPEPDLQSLRRTPTGSYYLDMRWSPWGVSVEVDGIQHAWATHIVGDSLRHNSIAIDGDIVLRLPVLGLRTCPDEFFAQVERALVARGWRRDEAA